MTDLADRSMHDSSLVLRLLTAILLTGATLLAAAEGGAVASPGLLAAGLFALWGSLAATALIRRGRCCAARRWRL